MEDTGINGTQQLHMIGSATWRLALRQGHAVRLVEQQNRPLDHERDCALLPSTPAPDLPSVQVQAGASRLRPPDSSRLSHGPGADSACSRRTRGIAHRVLADSRVATHGRALLLRSSAPTSSARSPAWREADAAADRR